MPSNLTAADYIRMLGPAWRSGKFLGMPPSQLPAELQEDVGPMAEGRIEGPADVDAGLWDDLDLPEGDGLLGDVLREREAAAANRAHQGIEGPSEEMLLMSPGQLSEVPVPPGDFREREPDPSITGEDVGLGPGFDPEMVGGERPLKNLMPFAVGPDLTKPFAGGSPEPMRPYVRAPSAPGVSDPEITQADMEEAMQGAIYGGRTPIAPRAGRRARLSPSRQRELAQRKFLTRFMHPSETVLTGDPRAWPHLTKMALGRMQAGTQGQALQAEASERLARESFIREQLVESTRAARAAESLGQASLTAEGQRASEALDLSKQQHDERMAQYETEARRLESEGKAAEARSVREAKQREEDQNLAREESEDIRSDSRADGLRNTAQTMRARAEDMTSMLTDADRDNLRSRADELDIQADTIQGVEPPPVGELPPPVGGLVPGDSGLSGLSAGDAEKQLERQSPGWYGQFEANVKLYGAESAGVRGPLESPGEWFSWFFGGGDYHPGDVNGLWYMRSFINDAIARGIITDRNIKAVGAILKDRVISDVWGAMPAAEKGYPGTQAWFDALKAGRLPDEKLLGFRYRKRDVK